MAADAEGDDALSFPCSGLTAVYAWELWTFNLTGMRKDSWLRGECSMALLLLQGNEGRHAALLLAGLQSICIKSLSLSIDDFQ